MINLHNRKAGKDPEIMLSPMIDMSFLLLVFFIFISMHMNEMNIIPVKLPVAANTQLETKNSFNVTVKNDGALWLGDKFISREVLLAKAKEEYHKDRQFAVIIRANDDVSYKTLISLLDDFKSAGVTRVGLAVERRTEK